MNKNTVSFYNLLTKSQITFLTDREFPDFLVSMTTKDNRLFSIGTYRAFELMFASRSLLDKAKLNEARTYCFSSIVYEPT